MDEKDKYVFQDGIAKLESELNAIKMLLVKVSEQINNADFKTREELSEIKSKLLDFKIDSQDKFRNIGKEIIELSKRLPPR